MNGGTGLLFYNKRLILIKKKNFKILNQVPLQLSAMMLDKTKPMRYHLVLVWKCLRQTVLFIKDQYNCNTGCVYWS